MNKKRFYKKTYMLEVLSNGVTESSFAFSVPPQNEEFVFPQRITETKTFGGVVIDDYGNDTVKITLSGTTINQELKTIYRLKENDLMLNGEDEVFYLKNIISTYGTDIYKLKNKQMYLYDLDSFKWWEGVVQDFQIKRSKENPNAYYYTLVFLGLPNDRSKKQSWADKLFSLSKIKELCEKIKYGADSLEEILKNYKGIVDNIASLKNFVSILENDLLRYSDIIGGFIDTTSNAITETISLGDHIAASAVRLVFGTGLNIYNTVTNLLKAVKDIVKIVDTIKVDDITTDLIEQYRKTTTEIKDVCSIIAGNMESAVNEVKAETDKEIGNYSYVPAQDYTGDYPLVTMGFKECTVKDSDTWDSLAKEHYNDPTLASAIAMYNANEMGVKNLEVGKKILLPGIGISNTNPRNKIYPPVDKKDNYGTDVKISKNDISIQTNDISTIGGVDNLGQAITNRLTTALGSRVRVNTYGLKTQIGEPTITKSYIIASLYQTLKEEPRIENIQTIKFHGKGEQLQIDIEYTDINGNLQTYGGLF